jgi:hypothetical protein
VFDADDSGESAYIVSEWVSGETLEGMLGKAPLEPGRAATLLYEASEAISAAHAAGLSHLCLTPRDLVWTTGGTVKLLGVAIDAVLTDRQSDDPAAEDVHGLGRMLYAALTAHWPGDEDGSGLPAAPAADDVPHAPRQVQAGISHAIDAIVCRCLGIGQAEPLATPADLAKALRGVPRTPLPLFAGLGHASPASPRTTPPRRPATPSTAATTQPHRPPAAETPASSHVPPPRSRAQRHAAPPPATSTRTSPAHGHAAPKRPANRALLGIAAAALTVIVGLGAWALSGTGGDGDPKDGGVTDKGQASTQPKPSLAKLTPRNIQPAELRAGPGNGDDTIGKHLSSVIDGKPGGTWETQSYADAGFGRLSKGLGVLLDMGESVKIANVKIHSPVSGGTLQVRVGDSQSPTALQRVGEQAPNGGELTITANPQATGRYVLVWFTQLPGGPFKGRLGEITVYGAAG